LTPALKLKPELWGSVTTGNGDPAYALGAELLFGFKLPKEGLSLDTGPRWSYDFGPGKNNFAWPFLFTYRPPIKR